MISLLLPSRGRPENIARLWQSVKDTGQYTNQIEMIVRLDEDDAANYPRIKSPNVKYIVGPRDVLSKYWNECYEIASGDILMHCGDDIIFRTMGWDATVESEFQDSADKLLFVHGDDMGGNGPNFGTHGFLHRRWVEIIGYFVPPYFSSDYNDTWWNDVANMIGRRRYLDFQTEHMHPAFSKGPMDITHQERLERHRNDNVDERYGSNDMRQERQDDAQKLREHMQ